MAEVGSRELFLGFARIGLLGFGGVAAIARHVIVEEREWLDDRDYAAVLGMGQILPGANTVNAAVIIGDRFHGPRGAVAAVLGLMAAPLAVLIAVAGLYSRFGDLPDVQAGLKGAAAAAAGLVIGTALKMARNLKPEPVAALAGAAAFAAAAIFAIPLVWTVLLLAPLSVFFVWRGRRA
jgi:chromate transporter